MKILFLNITLPLLRCSTLCFWRILIKKMLFYLSLHLGKTYLFNSFCSLLRYTLEIRETVDIKTQGKTLEVALAESIWARYCVHIRLEKKAIGNDICLAKIFPRAHLPKDLKDATISLKGIGFSFHLITFSDTSKSHTGILKSKRQLPTEGVQVPEKAIILNGYGAKADLIITGLSNGLTWYIQAKQNHLCGSVRST